MYTLFQANQVEFYARLQTKSSQISLETVPQWAAHTRIVIWG